MTTSGVVKIRIVDAQEEARKIVAEAEEQAEVIRKNMDQREKEAVAAGFKKGYQEGLGQLTSSIVAASELRDSALDGAEDDLLRLAIKIAEKIIGRELDRDENVLVDIVSTALRHLRQRHGLRLHVNPRDLKILQNFQNRLSAANGNYVMDIVPDKNVQRGGCVIDSSVGRIDAQLSSQLKILERELLKTRRNHERSA
jgi:type III secretion protein L